jgi:hypothetical protein
MLQSEMSNQYMSLSIALELPTLQVVVETNDTVMHKIICLYCSKNFVLLNEMFQMKNSKKCFNMGNCNFKLNPPITN